jgi:1-deoxy-D-xylulose 5-phosphate reductoisomerase
VAVDAFVSGRIGFTDIPSVLARTVARHVPAQLLSLDDVQSVMTEATAVALEITAGI